MLLWKKTEKAMCQKRQKRDSHNTYTIIFSHWEFRQTGISDLIVVILIAYISSSFSSKSGKEEQENEVQDEKLETQWKREMANHQSNQTYISLPLAERYLQPNPSCPCILNVHCASLSNSNSLYFLELSQPNKETKRQLFLLLPCWTLCPCIVNRS